MLDRGIAYLDERVEAMTQSPTQDDTPALLFDADSHPDLSHDQLALDLGRHRWNDRARYVEERGRWLFWTGSRWELDKTLRHMTEVREFLREMAQDLERWAERRASTMQADARDKLLRWARAEARGLRQASTRAHVESTARSNPGLAASVDQFDAGLDVVGTPCGVVDLRTGEQRGARQEDYITRHVSAAPSNAEPSRWLAFLHDAMDGNAEMVAFLQRLAGYALTGHTTEHKLPFVFGPGGNGKSVFANVLHEVMADYSARAPAEAFLSSNGQRHPTDLAGLEGARLVIGSELPAGRAWNESVIKDLTGGDPITARYMRQDYFTYVPQFTLLIVGNHQPSIGAVDDAMRRRLVLIPFTATIPPDKRDPELPAKLREEYAAILAWMIDGACDWYRQGLNTPQSVQAASDEYLEAEDVLGQFIDENLYRDPAHDGGPLSSEIYERYREWIEAQGGRPMTNRALTQALREKGMSITRDRDGRRLHGYRLTPSTQRDQRPF